MRGEYRYRLLTIPKPLNRAWYEADLKYVVRSQTTTFKRLGEEAKDNMMLGLTLGTCGRLFEAA